MNLYKFQSKPVDETAITRVTVTGSGTGWRPVTVAESLALAKIVDFDQSDPARAVAGDDGGVGPGR